MGFQLDTSGYVQCPAPDQKPNESTGCWFWSDLTPFAQGYVEALFSSAEHPGYLDVEPGNCDAGHMQVGFRHLAPETLARVIADCERQSEVYTDRNPDRVDGGVFWSGRQHNVLVGRGFPPLIVTLGDDGKVRFQ